MWMGGIEGRLRPLGEAENDTIRQTKINDIYNKRLKFTLLTNHTIFILKSSEKKKRQILSNYEKKNGM